jgi:hypothetical protein
VLLHVDEQRPAQREAGQVLGPQAHGERETEGGVHAQDVQEFQASRLVRDVVGLGDLGVVEGRARLLPAGHDERAELVEDRLGPPVLEVEAGRWRGQALRRHRAVAGQVQPPEAPIEVEDQGLQGAAGETQAGEALERSRETVGEGALGLGADEGIELGQALLEEAAHLGVALVVRERRVVGEQVQEGRPLGLESCRVVEAPVEVGHGDRD